MSNVQKQAPGVDTVMLKRIFVVTCSSRYVDVTPSNSSLYPPNVIWTQWFSALCGLISATMQTYVAVFPMGTLSMRIKKIVLFPFFMRIPTS